MRLARLLWIGLAVAGINHAQSPTVPSNLAASQDSEAPVKANRLRIRHQPPAPLAPENPSGKLAAGTVELLVTLDPTGRPEKAEALEGPLELRPTAEANALEWRFEPYVVDGKAVRAQTKLIIAFTGRAIGKTPQWDRVVLAKGLFSQCTTPELDGKALEQDLCTWLTSRAKVKLVEGVGEPTSETCLLDVQLTRFPPVDGIASLALDIAATRPGGPPAPEGQPKPLWRSHHVVYQPGKAVALSVVETVLHRALGQLFEVPPNSIPPEHPGLLIDGKPAGHVVAFDFREIKILKQPKSIEYPAVARIARITGKVIVDITMDRSGKPLFAEILSGPPQLMPAAASYALQLEFEPPGVETGRFRLTLPFTLR